MIFPLWYLLVPYGLVVLGTGLFVFFNLYHVAKFGVQAPSTTFLLCAYSVAYIAMLVVSVIVLGGYNWQQQTSLSEILPFLNGGDSTGGSSTFGL